MSGQAAVQTQIAARPTITPIASGLLQRQCACGQHTSAGGECEECKKKREGTLQRAVINPSPVHDVPPLVHEVLRSPGQPLDPATRAIMEPRFGHDWSTVRSHTITPLHAPARLALGVPHNYFEQEAEATADRVMKMSTVSNEKKYDFGDVRIHTDTRAAESAQAIDALAYTVGRNVVFGEGQYAPTTAEGQRLIAHELTHVTQQTEIVDSLEIQRQTRPGTDVAAGEPSTASSILSPFSDFGAALQVVCRVLASVLRTTERAVVTIAEVAGRAAATAVETEVREEIAELLEPIVRILQHPLIRIVAPVIARQIPAIQQAVRILLVVYRLYREAATILRAIRTALAAMIHESIRVARIIARAFVTAAAASVGGRIGRHIRGVWRHLEPKLAYLAENWWDVIMNVVGSLIWPFPHLAGEYRRAIEQEYHALRHLCNLEWSEAGAAFLRLWRSANNILGLLYGWFTIASVLTGGLIGTIVGGPPGFFAGAGVGFEAAEYVGLGLLASFVVAETINIGAAAYDLYQGPVTEERSELDYEQIANSSVALGITGAMVALGALAARIARALIERWGRRIWELPALRGRRGGPPARGDVFEFRLYLAALVRGLRRLRLVTWMERIRRNTPGFDLLSGGEVLEIPRPGRAPIYEVRGGVLISSKSTQGLGARAVSQIRVWIRELAGFNGRQNVVVTNPAGRHLTVALETPLDATDVRLLQTEANNAGVTLELASAVPLDHPAFIFVDDIPQLTGMLGREVAREIEELEEVSEEEEAARPRE